MRFVLLRPRNSLEGCWLWQGRPVADWSTVKYLWGQFCPGRKSVPASARVRFPSCHALMRAPAVLHPLSVSNSCNMGM